MVDRYRDLLAYLKKKFPMFFAFIASFIRDICCEKLEWKSSYNIEFNNMCHQYAKANAKKCLNISSARI